MKSPKLLVMISSAGVNPWLEIEEVAQRPILERLLGNEVDVVWVEPSPEVSKRVVARVLDSLVFGQMMLKYAGKKESPICFLRRVIAKFANWFPYNAVGSGIQNLYCDVLLRRSPPTWRGKRLRLPIPHGYGFTGRRSIEALNATLENYQFDYLLRLTSTCLVNPIALRRTLKAMPTERVYAGQLQKFASVAYNSGSNLLLSRDVVESIVANASSLMLDIWEDVALGSMIRRLDLADFYEMPRVDVKTRLSLSKMRPVDFVSVPVLRCKAESTVTTMAQPVIEIMEGIWSRFGEAWRAESKEAEKRESSDSFGG